MNYLNITKSFSTRSIILFQVSEYCFNIFSCFSTNIADIYCAFSKLFIDLHKFGSLISKDFICHLNDLPDQ